MKKIVGFRTGPVWHLMSAVSHGVRVSAVSAGLWSTAHIYSMFFLCVRQLLSSNPFLICRYNMYTACIF